MIDNPIKKLISGEGATELVVQLQKIVDLSVSKFLKSHKIESVDYRIIINHPSREDYGDYSTNVALMLSSRLKLTPEALAQSICDEINDMIRTDQSIAPISWRNNSNTGEITVSDILEKCDIAGSGFINMWLNEIFLITQTSRLLSKLEPVTTTQINSKKQTGLLTGTKIMMEFAHPNTHKEFHIGHLRNISLGESLVRLLERVGSEVFRANYEGDVGLHVAKAIWGVRKKIKSSEFRIQNLRKLTPAEKAKFLGEGYALGSKEYENEDAKKEIMDLNKSIYNNPYQVDLWEETRGWSLEYFDTVYKRLGSRFDRLFFESEVEKKGRDKVKEGVKKGIFIEDKDGSIYFPGEKYGLNNCVFVTREDYATYEGKEIALEELEYKTFPFDLDIHVVANEQINFFQIAFKAVEMVHPVQKGRQYHLPYGMVNLKTGKISSRTGQVITADHLLDQAKLKILKLLKPGYSKEDQEEIAEKTAVAAVKYTMLRVGPKMDIAFDLEESVSFDGDSGPYLLYTYARCRSVLRRAVISSKKQVASSKYDEINKTHTTYYLLLTTEERSLLRAFYRFEEVVDDAVVNLSPNLICSYLFELAQKFNLFYSRHSILKPDNKEPAYAELSSATAGEQTKDNREDIRHPSGSRMDSLGVEKSVKNFRLFLTQATSQIIKEGLYLLGIETVERM